MCVCVCMSGVARFVVCVRVCAARVCIWMCVDVLFVCMYVRDVSVCICADLLFLNRFC